MIWVLTAAAVMLTAAALLLVFRVTVGPTILDRSMALDVMMSVMVCAVSLYVIQSEQAWAVPVLLVLAAVGFVGAVSIARFASGAEDEDAAGDENDPAEEVW